MHDDPWIIEELMEEGAKGFLRKNCSFDELVDMLFAVHSDVLLTTPKKLETPLDVNARELLVLKMICDGKTSDEIAERILTLQGTPLHAYSDFLKISSIKEDKNVSDGVACVKGILTGLTMTIAKEREIIDLADEDDDQGTADQLTAYVQEQEKLVWMYNAYLG
jgi:hypothetical protein